MSNYNLIIGALSIVAGGAIIIVALGELLVRLIIGLAALALINYGFKLRGMPPLQLMLTSFIARKRRWF